MQSFKKYIFCLVIPFGCVVWRCRIGVGASTAMPVETLDIEMLFSAGVDSRNDGICEIIILLTRMGHSYTEREYACGIAILQASTFEAGRSGGMGTLRPETKDGEEEE